MATRSTSEASPTSPNPAASVSNGSTSSPPSESAPFPKVPKGGKPLLDTLLKKNAQWSHDVSSVDKYFFKTSAIGQAPKVLWIGCCDSRVPETTLVAARPGDIFVHRNIANQFHPSDDSAQAALAYAVGAAGVQHVLVVGHTVCGGCMHAFGAPPEAAADQTTPLSRFLAPLIELRHSLPKESQIEPGEPTILQDLVEANVEQAVQAIAATETVQANWALKGAKGVQIHGLVYHLDTGRLHNLHVSLVPPEDEIVEDGPDGTRIRRGSTSATREEKDIGVSALLQDLKIPEHAPKVASPLPAGTTTRGEDGQPGAKLAHTTGQDKIERMEETPMATGL